MFNIHEIKKTNFVFGGLIAIEVLQELLHTERCY